MCWETLSQGTEIPATPIARISLEGSYLAVSFCQREIAIIIKTHPADWWSHLIWKMDLCSELRKMLPEIISYSWASSSPIKSCTGSKGLKWTVSLVSGRQRNASREERGAGVEEFLPCSCVPALGGRQQSLRTGGSLGTLPSVKERPKCPLNGKIWHFRDSPVLLIL